MMSVTDRMTRAWPVWLPGPLPVAVWLATRAALLALVGEFYPWEWYPDLLYEWILTITAGGNPYLGLQAYPPVSMLAFLIPGALSPSPAAFRVVYPLFIVLIDLAILLWMRRAERDGFRHATLAYALAMPAIGPILLLWRFDLLPALCQVAATVCAIRGARTWSWAWLGIGIALKLYLAALVPLWIAWELASRRRERDARVAAIVPSTDAGLARRIGTGLALAGGPVIVLAVVALVVWGPRSLEPYTYSFGRGVTIDSTPATLIAELGRTGLPTSWSYEADCFCPVRSAGPAVDAPLRTAFSLLGVAGALLLAVWYVRAPGPRRLAAASAGITALAAFASPILSPQHLVWPLAPLALVAFDPRGRTALGLAMLAAATAAYAWLGPTFQVHVYEYTDLGRALLLTRAGAELGALLVLGVPLGLELGRARAARVATARK